MSGSRFLASLLFASPYPLNVTRLLAILPFIGTLTCMRVDFEALTQKNCAEAPAETACDGGICCGGVCCESCNSDGTCAVPATCAVGGPALVSNRWTRLDGAPDPNASGDGACGGVPCPRAWHAMEYAAHTCRAVVMGGSGGGCSTAPRVNDVWAYDFVANTWQRLRPFDSALSVSLDAHSLAEDPGGTRLWVFGGVCEGGFSSYDLATNTFVSAPIGAADAASRQGALGFAQGGGHLVAFAGTISDEQDRTLTFDLAAQQWSAARPALVPAARYEIQEAMVYSPTHQRFILMGGYFGSEAAPDLLDDTWEYDLSTNEWLRPPNANDANPHPPARAAHAMVWDAAHGVAILHGGYGDCGSECSDTWVYDPSTQTWKELSGGAGPTRAHPGLAYDRANDVILLWGGASALDSDAWSEVWALRYQP